MKRIENAAPAPLEGAAGRAAGRGAAGGLRRRQVRRRQFGQQHQQRIPGVVRPDGHRLRLPARVPAPGRAPAAAASTTQSFTPLSWSQTDPTTQYTLADGTLVTQIGGRVRDRHAREQPATRRAPATRTTCSPRTTSSAASHQVTIYDNVSPTNPASTS